MATVVINITGDTARDVQLLMLVDAATLATPPGVTLPAPLDAAGDGTWSYTFPSVPLSRYVYTARVWWDDQAFADFHSGGGLLTPPTISGSAWPAPTLFYPRMVVTLGTPHGADVYYAINGEAPCPGDRGTYQYTGPLTLDRTTLLSAAVVVGGVVGQPAWGRFVRDPVGAPTSP